MKTISPQSARDSGLTKYFTGVACKHGHIAPRLTKSANCTACLAARRKPPRERIGAQESKRRYREKNRERLREAYREYCAKNPEKVRQQKRAYASRNAECERARAKAKYYANKERYNANTKRRNAQRRGAAGAFYKEDLDRIFSDQKGRCAYCRRHLTDKTRSIDHISPIALNGTNHPANIQFTCMPCNRSKSARAPEEFARSMGLLL